MSLSTKIPKNQIASYLQTLKRQKRGCSACQIYIVTAVCLTDFNLGYLSWGHWSHLVRSNFYNIKLIQVLIDSLTDFKSWLIVKMWVWVVKRKEAVSDWVSVGVKLSISPPWFNTLQSEVWVGHRSADLGCFPHTLARPGQTKLGNKHPHSSLLSHWSCFSGQSWGLTWDLNWAMTWYESWLPDEAQLSCWGHWTILRASYSNQLDS